MTRARGLISNDLVRWMGHWTANETSHRVADVEYLQVQKKLFFGRRLFALGSLEPRHAGILDY